MTHLMHYQQRCTSLPAHSKLVKRQRPQKTDDLFFLHKLYGLHPGSISGINLGFLDLLDPKAWSEATPLIDVTDAHSLLQPRAHTLLLLYARDESVCAFVSFKITFTLHGILVSPLANSSSPPSHPCSPCLQTLWSISRVVTTANGPTLPISAVALFWCSRVMYFLPQSSEDRHLTSYCDGDIIWVVALTLYQHCSSLNFLSATATHQLPDAVKPTKGRSWTKTSRISMSMLRCLYGRLKLVKCALGEPGKSSICLKVTHHQSVCQYIVKVNVRNLHGMTCDKKKTEEPGSSDDAERKAGGSLVRNGLIVDSALRSPGAFISNGYYRTEWGQQGTRGETNGERAHRGNTSKCEFDLNFINVRLLGLLVSLFTTIFTTVAATLRYWRSEKNP